MRAPGPRHAPSAPRAAAQGAAAAAGGCACMRRRRCRLRASRWRPRGAHHGEPAGPGLVGLHVGYGLRAAPCNAGVSRGRHRLRGTALLLRAARAWRPAGCGRWSGGCQAPPRQTARPAPRPTGRRRRRGVTQKWPRVRRRCSPAATPADPLASRAEAKTARASAAPGNAAARPRGAARPPRARGPQTSTRGWRPPPATAFRARGWRARRRGITAKAAAQSAAQATQRLGTGGSQFVDQGPGLADDVALCAFSEMAASATVLAQRLGANAATIHAGGPSP